MQSSVRGTFSLSGSLDVQVAIPNRQWGTRLEAKNEFGAGETNLSVICVEMVLKPWDCMRSPTECGERI